jgi:hypothetical protein
MIVVISQLDPHAKGYVWWKYPNTLAFVTYLYLKISIKARILHACVSFHMVYTILINK